MKANTSPPFGEKVEQLQAADVENVRQAVKWTF
jgi:hypothetical protein